MLNFKKENDFLYSVNFNSRLVGELLRDVDGFYYYWPEKNLTGAWPEWVLRQTADKLNELNKSWGDLIEKELKTNNV